MKLQKRLNRRVGDTEYTKWEVDIPPEKIKEIGWKEGTELDVIIKDGKLILKEKND
jgi:hypothetical protein